VKRHTKVVRVVGILPYLFTVLIFMGYEAPVASAQVLYGSVVGTVTDRTGSVVPKAAVKITSTTTGLSREVAADSAGYYSIPNLPQGDYELTASAPGFKPLTQKGIAVLINQVTHMDVSLEVGGFTESITVEATGALLQTTKADVNVSLESKAISNLPLPGYRNYQSLINLVPGATPGRFQNAITDTPGRALTTNINGQDRGANNTRVDGSANILVTLPHHTVYVPPVESIQEVNISTNNFDAEQGITGGAAVTVTTKSGTNEFHGGAFALHQNAAFRSFLWDENRAGVKIKPKGIRNIDGANIGGPIKKNKLFFFANWEGTFERSGFSSLFSVPTADLRAGDFSSKLGDLILDGNVDADGNPAPRPILVPTTEGGSTPLREGMIFDPYSGNPDGTGRVRIFQRWTDQRHSCFPAERPDGEIAGIGTSPKSAWRRKQLFQFRHTAREPQ
jgi:Carboxypeptidase regulatory-like domain